MLGIHRNDQKPELIFIYTTISKKKGNEIETRMGANE